MPHRQAEGQAHAGIAGHMVDQISATLGRCQWAPGRSGKGIKSVECCFLLCEIVEPKEILRVRHSRDRPSRCTN